MLRNQREDYSWSSETRAPSPRVSVVIPTLNEGANLPRVLSRLSASIHEVVVVDGHSTDDTVAVARAARPDARVLLVRERGKGVALRAGFRAATGDVVVAMDADGSTDPVEIPAFVGMLVAGADVALGSRFAVGGGTDDMDRLRAVGNWMLTRFVRFAFRARYSDLCYGFFAFWRDVLPDLDGSFVGFEVETVVHIRALKAGLRVAEVPSYEARRLSGQSNLRTFPDGFRILRAIIAEYRSAKRVPPTSLGRSVRAALWQSSEMSAGGEELSV